MQPAIGLLEFDSIAVGVLAGDAMVKRAPVTAVYAGTIHPGRYVVLVGGPVADVEEALDAGTLAGTSRIVGRLFLADVHPDVVDAIGGRRRRSDGEAIGVIETSTVAATVDAADGGVKGAAVDILEVRLGDGLGGKGYVVFGGTVAEVEAAVGYGTDRIDPAEQLVAQVVVAQLHDDMRDNLEVSPRFGDRVGRTREEA